MLHLVAEGPVANKMTVWPGCVANADAEQEVAKVPKGACLGDPEDKTKQGKGLHRCCFSLVSIVVDGFVWIFT